MSTLIRRLLAQERIRFLIVGGINTLLGYGLFAVFELTFGKHLGTLGYLLSLYASYVIAVFIAFSLHRRFTFRVAGTGRVVIDFLRFAAVNLLALGINTVLLPLFVEWFHFQPLVAQGLIVVITTLTSYFGHKLFSFRRSPA